MKRLLSVFMALAILFTSAVVEFPLTAVTAQAATNGVQSQIDKLRAVYPTGSAFTVASDSDGKGIHCTNTSYAAEHKTDYSCPNCYLPSIPSRGGLPSGAQVGDGAWGCASFAYYAYYVIFGHNKNSKTTKVTSPSLGDLVHMFWTEAAGGGQHWFIYLGEDSSNYYVYDANYGTPPSQNVRYNAAIPKSKIDWFSEIFHATDYSNVQPAEDITYTDITPGTYYFVNKGTGKALNLENNIDANKTNVHMYDLSLGYPSQQMVVSVRSSTDKSYKIRPTSSSRLVQPFGDNGVTNSGMNVNIYDDVNDNTQWWHFQSVSGGYVIRNAANTSCVLTASNGNAIVSTYTGSSNQIWTLQPLNQKYTVSYNANGGSGTMANTEMTVGTAANLRANAFTRTGYTFLGWSTSASATSATYTDKQSVKDLAKSGTVTLYAVWKPNTYTIIYNANGGSGSMANTAMTYDTAANLRANTFTRTDYAFIGWSTSASASTVTYYDKQSVKNLAASGTVTLYAVWSVIIASPISKGHTTTSTSITLLWEPHPTAESITATIELNGTKIRSVTLPANTTSYTFTDLKPGTTYDVSEWADYDGARIGYTSQITTAVEAPTAVTGFTGTATSNSVALSWKKNTSADSYKIKQLVNGTWKELVKTSSNATTSYTVKNLSPNTEYQFAIYAFKGSQYSAAKKVTIKTTAAKPTAVTGLKGTATSNSIKLTWNKNSSADSYKIKQLVNGTWKELVKTSSNATTYYTVKNLSPNTEYQFAIYAFKGSQYSAATKIKVKTTAAKPTAVTGLKGTATSNSIKLTWNKNSSADSYKVKQIVNGQLKELVKTSSNSTTSYTITGLKPNTTYEFSVIAFKGSQYGTSARITIKTTAAKPSAVTNLKGTSTSNSVTLSWVKNSGADSYKIKQIVNGQLKELVKISGNSTTTYVVTGLKPNTSYEFAVYAFKGSQYSTAAKITVKTAAAKPSAVTNLKGTSTSNSVTLTWTKNSGADSYKVKQIVNGQSKELVKISGNSTTTYVVTGLKPNTTYEFAVYAFKGSQYSSASKITVRTSK